MRTATDRPTSGIQDPFTSPHAAVGGQPGADRRQSGFTLLEMMVAVAIIAIALVSVYRLHAQTIGLTAITRFNATAPRLALSRLSLLEAQPLTEASDDTGDFGSEHPGYAYKIAISDVESDFFKDPGPRLKKIEIEVSLEEEGQTYKLVTYRLENE